VSPSSAAAVKLARKFVAGLAEAGYVVVSSLARGIDGAAITGAIPATIGVIASGIDIAYPPQHADLQAQIATDGLLLAEQPPGTEPRSSHFPSRNRIIAGFAAGSLVVEAAPKSGLLITACLAAEAGREIMAILGSPLARVQSVDPQRRCAGADVRGHNRTAVELRWHPAFDFSRAASARLGAAPEEIAGAGAADVPGLLTNAPVAFDELIRQSGASAAEVQMALLELEISGRLQCHAAGRFSLNA
jgi:DNA processing protein